VKVFILSIGDELTLGEVIDSNAAHISAALYRCGLKVALHLTVGDNEPDIMDALQQLGEKADVVIVTGGLGPTTDDITARAAAKASGRRLILNDEALQQMQGVKERLGGDLHPLNEKQALLPAKTTVIPNPTGTACGFQYTHNGHLFFFLPGVPSEMARMLDDTVIPYLLERRKQRVFTKTRVLKLFGPSEAEVDGLLKGLGGGEVTVAFCVNFPEILVKFRAEGENEQYLDEILAGACEAARERLKGFVFAEGDDTMDTVVARLFRETGQTLALAESCTGGLVAARITDLPGSSAYFLEGAVTYSNGAKIRQLLVPAPLLDEKGAVSSEVAMAMAKGMRQAAGSDIALAVTGIAGPDGGTAEKPVGTVFICLATRAGCRTKGYRFSGSRGEIRTITAFMAMDWLRRHLQSLPSLSAPVDKPEVT
jgi:nicotinamide-nucleotide amidase